MRAVLVALLLIVAAPPVAATEAQEFGAAISPVPLVVEDWDAPAFLISNRGTVPVTGVIEIARDSGYAVAVDRVELEPQEQISVPLVRIGEGEANVRLTVASVRGGTDQHAIVLETRIRHLSPFERLPWQPFAIGAASAVLGLLLAARRRTRGAIRRSG